LLFFPLFNAQIAPRDDVTHGLTSSSLKC